MNLSAVARQRLEQHLSNTAKAYGRAVGQEFSATPSVAQTIYNRIVEDGNPFLSQINAMVPVTELTGDKIGLFLSNRVASRTDTSGSGERTAKHLIDTDSKGYTLKPTEFDVALRYAQIDSWAKFPDFRERWQALVRMAMGNDMLQTGWTGTSAAATTNLSSNPLLQDLNIGWLKKIRDYNSGSQRVAGTTEVPIALGSTAFPNLDVLAHSAKQRLPVWYRNHPDLVLMVSNNLLASQEETYYETNGNKPTEKGLLSSGLITRAYANMPTIVPPFFPDGTLFITTLKNLSIYYQDTSVRRIQKDKPEKNEVQDFNSVNMGYVVEDELMTSLVDNVTLA